jgi:hypothetical protein
MSGLDGFGIQGMAAAGGVLLFFTGSALILFVYLWSKGRLDFDEAPKQDMFDD